MLCDPVIEFRLDYGLGGDKISEVMVSQAMNSLGSYAEEFGLDLANIWEPLKVYK